jgi:hypothetical protein
VKYFALFRDNDLPKLEQYNFTKTGTEHNLYAYGIIITFFLLVHTIRMNTEHKRCQDEMHTTYLTFYENITIKNMLQTLIAPHDWLIALLTSAAKNANCKPHHIKRYCY